MYIQQIILARDSKLYIQKAFVINIRLHGLDILLGILYEDNMFIIINFFILYGKK